MTQPTPYSRTYSFSGFQTSNPADPLPGTDVDGQLDLIAAFTQAVVNALALIQRSDGQLANQSVGLDQLQAGLALGLNAVTNWAAGTAYSKLAGVWNGNALYVCLAAHTSSSSFANDLAAGDWLLIVDFSGELSQATTQASNAAASASSAAASATTATNEAGTATTEAGNASASATAAAASATAAANSAAVIPAPAAGNELDFIRVNAAGTAYETRTPAQALADMGGVSGTIGTGLVSNIATNYTLTGSDGGKIFASGAANLTATLPLLSSVPDGYEVGFQAQNVTFTIAASGSDKIYGPNWWGVGSAGLDQQGAAIRVKKEGTTGWLVIDKAFPFATASDMQAAAASDLIVSPTSWAAVALASPAQSWQNLSGSRAANTTYTNTTGRPIAIAVDCGVSGAALHVAGVQVGNYGSSPSTAFAIIPIGASYYIDNVFGYWAEYR